MMNMVAFNVETNKYYDDNENRFTFEIHIFYFSFIWIAFIETDFQQTSTPTARVRISQVQIIGRPDINDGQRRVWTFILSKKETLPI